MSALLCAQCNAPLTMEVAQGRAPCGFCGVLNSPGAPAPAPNPYGPQAAGQVRAVVQMSAPSPSWICPSCNKENEAHYKFCLGCGGVLNAHPENAVATATPQQRGFLTIAIVIAVIILFVVGGIIAAAVLMVAR